MTITANSVLLTETDVSELVANLFFKANYQLPADVFKRLNSIYSNEVGPNAKEATRQIIENAVKARKNERPMCQDTGFPVVFVQYGQQVQFEGDFDLTRAINAGVVKGYKENYLRKSMVKDPVFDRTNTGDNTPAIIHFELVPNSTDITIMVEPKGTGAESMSTLKMLKPSQGVEGIKEFILDSVFHAGASPCPPILLGLGIGGTFEKAALMAKRSLFDPILSPEELDAKAKAGDKYAGLALEIINMVNETGIGTQGLGGVQMCLGVNIRTFGTHIGALPVALNIQCHAARHAEGVLHQDGSVTYYGETITETQDYIHKPDVPLGKVVQLQTPLTAEDFKALRAGDRVEITGTLYTARDAAHKRMLEEYDATGKLPFDLTNQILYYVGPTPAKPNEIIGSAGPTTAGRMDKYAPRTLELGLKGMIGKGYRSPEVQASIKQHGAVYFVAIGGLGVIIAETIKKSDVVAYPELGPEAIYKLEVDKFPAIVAFDSEGNNLHELAREEYRQRPLPADMA